MKEENTKRTPISERVRLMFKMLATITLAIGLISQILATSQLKHLKIQKTQKLWLNSHILAVSHTACEHRSPRRKVIICSKQTQLNETSRLFIFCLQSTHCLNAAGEKMPSG